MLVPVRDKFFAAGEEPWHRIGVTVDEAQTLEGALTLSNLDVRSYHLDPLVSQHGEIEGKYLVYMQDAKVSDSPVPVAIVGGRYTIHQLRDVFGFMDSLGDGVKWVNMGAIKGNSVVFGTVDFEPIILDPNGANEVVNRYGLAMTSFDGSSKTYFGRNNFRPDCWNMITAFRGRAPHSIEFKHTSDITTQVAQAREALNITFAYDAVFEAEMQTLIETEVNAAQFMDIVNRVYGKPKEDASKSAKTRYINRVDILGDLFSGGSDELRFTLENVRGTAYAAYNAINEYDVWYAQRRGDEKDEARLIAANGLDQSIVNQNGKALDAILDWDKDNRRVSIPV